MKTKNVQHTPGPFVAVKCDKNDHEPHAWKICTDSIDRRQQVAQVIYAERNAKFFAHAGNCHDDLLAALREFAEYPCNCSGKCDGTCSGSKARAAIAKAEAQP